MASRREHLPRDSNVDDLSGMKILSPGSRTKSFSGDLSNKSKSNSVTTLPLGSMSSRSEIRPEIDDKTIVGSPPTDEILPLDIAVAIDSSN